MPHPNPGGTPTVGAVLDNRPSYLSFGVAWLLGYGAFAVSHGDDPGLPMPSAVPAVLLGGGLLTALIITGVVIARAQRGVRGREAVVGKLLAVSWLVGFGALTLLITALSTALNEEQVQTLLWPTGSGLIIGMIYLAGGAALHDVLQYTLGTWLAVMSSAALFLEGANMYWALALTGGGAYLVAAALESRRCGPLSAAVNAAP
ncbi:ABC transporter permease [Nocardia uniformis]|uniref:ABC transporter permease n=1 Tax=Nocardia uniformis TaxID=53432 RepID=A0A849BP99_9NOCA|nr:ABC transporter permease [Nocardia uniformis]NNH68403.1 ABC transporter permease [Nocardia uniformis]